MQTSNSRRLNRTNCIAYYGGERGGASNEVCAIAIVIERRPLLKGALREYIRKVSAGGSAGMMGNHSINSEHGTSLLSLKRIPKTLT